MGEWAAKSGQPKNDFNATYMVVGGVLLYTIPDWIFNEHVLVIKF